MNQERNAIDRIYRDLELPRGDSQTQNWVYELPSEYRNTGSLLKYAAAYSNTDYGEDEPRLLMQLMLDVTNYWAMPGRPPEETFRLTPLVRAVRDT